MHVLFVGFVWPEPSSSAAGQNITSYMRSCLDMQWQVSFCCAAEKTERSHNLTNMGIGISNIKLNCNSFNLHVLDIKPDIVIFDRYLSFEQFAWRVKESCPNAMLVLDAEDLHCLREARHTLSKQNIKDGTQNEFMQNNEILKPNNLSILYNDVTLRELACVYQSDLTLVLSSFEKELLQNHFNVPHNQVCHLPFILDACDESDKISKDLFTQKKNFVFIGNFRHAPNYHAAKILRENCWPQIRNILKKNEPDISCHVYGAYMSPKAKQLENKNIGFLLHGYAQSQFKVISEARVMLAPISFGAGVKGKLLDAMQCSTPSVTTPIGSEGISELPWPGVVASSIDSFVSSAVDLYSNQSQWEASNKQGQQILQADYNSIDNRQKFGKYLSEKFTHFVEHRKTNFAQKLLGHHQFQTSKYMSQWIEAKNK
jgi:glycosyltransferase involved in cell wall biosynthesis